MKTTTPTKLGYLLAGVLALTVTSIQADTFGSGGNAFTIDFVNIGNPGNGDDPGLGGVAYGGVSYTYRISTYEISSFQIVAAETASPEPLIFPVGHSPGGGGINSNKPAEMHTWYSAAAYVNWLNTSTGHQAAYDISFNETWTMTLWSSADAWQLDGENRFRHKDAHYFLPSEDEWYKAAYHQNTGVNADYWLYATGSNDVPIAVTSGTGAGTAIFNRDWPYPADVNEAGGLSPYGTMGQNGNALEFQESAWDGANDSASESRVYRGGYFYTTDPGDLSSTWRYPDGFAPDSTQGAGFRVASVPEPTSALLLLGSGAMLLLRRRRAVTR